ncbi:SAM-dependent methyltransferase [Virgisporangium aurantiacum]|uniref:S-adenosyl methyltransferase n=1 Tax=Virgisporangium aurantiacum TaxID=175570 RepID=A0A8J3ZD59_9ACTN|nr:SAM-dependent methyltransferase [Virgisporangium aurantiacum]GIJ59033.1 hypothetical protein Vau01_065490 [Virgisporangium aurantiacum]
MTYGLHLPMGVDPNRPSASRIYDYFLGGTHNFAADRAVAERAIELVPELPKIMKANRAFLHRAVRHAVADGVTQLLDLGAGIPTEGNVHDAALAADPRARVVYVDRDPVAVLHGNDLLAGVPNAATVHGDLLDPEALQDDPQIRALLDFDRPVCILMIAVLHFVPDGPALDAALAHYRTVAAPGSYLAVTHATNSARPEEINRITDLYNRTGTPLVVRNRDQLATIFEGWQLVPPGIVYGPEWRPDPNGPPVADPASYITLAGVGVKAGSSGR